MKRPALIDALVFVSLVVAGVASRLVQEATPLLPPNFHAIAAATLFAGFYFSRRSTAACMTVLAMLLSDAIIGGYEAPVMAAVYGSLLVPIAWRRWLRANLTAGRIATGALSSSLLFYLVTNFAVWAYWDATHTWQSLLRCYTVALPFFGFTLCGDMAYAAIAFTAYKLVCMRAEQPRAAVQHIA